MASVRFECDMLITKEVLPNAKEGERKWRWRSLRCQSTVDGDGDADDYEAMLSRSWKLSDARQTDPVFLFRCLGADDGPLSDNWWARTGIVWKYMPAAGSV